MFKISWRFFFFFFGVYVLCEKVKWDVYKLGESEIYYVKFTQ